MRSLDSPSPGRPVSPLQGRFHDVVRTSDGQVVEDLGWRSNLIVDSAWRLLAGLLANEEGLGGVVHWAVGRGHRSWDDAPVHPDPDTSSLHAEFARTRIRRDDIRYLSDDERPQGELGPRLETRSRFSWPDQPRTLREFGVYGGGRGAGGRAELLVNHVIHPRIDLAPGMVLDRRLRLSFRSEEPSRWLELPRHWLGEEHPTVVDGVGPVYAGALAEAGISTVADLARAEPTELSGVLPFVALVELRAKARLTLRTASELQGFERFQDLTAWEVIVTPTTRLANDAGSSLEEAARIREKVSALELTLIHPFLRGITMGELGRAVSPEARPPRR